MIKYAIPISGNVFSKKRKIIGNSRKESKKAIVTKIILRTIPSNPLV